MRPSQTRVSRVDSKSSPCVSPATACVATVTPRTAEIAVRRWAAEAAAEAAPEAAAEAAAWPAFDCAIGPMTKELCAGRDLRLWAKVAGLV